MNQFDLGYFSGAFSIILAIAIFLYFTPTPWYIVLGEVTIGVAIATILLLSLGGDKN